jgi:uncharacterized protein YndB with AHSA1/START domain
MWPGRVNGELVRHTVLAYPAHVVWDAITSRHALAERLAPNDFAPRPGHEFRIWFQPRFRVTGTVECRVVEVEQPRRLSYTWRVVQVPEPTLVTWELWPVGAGVRLRVGHAGFRGLRGIVPAAQHQLRWRQALKRLAGYLQRQYGSDDRC